MKKLKKLLSVVLVLVMIFGVNATTRMQEVSAAGTTIIGNNTMTTAYNFGRWQLISSTTKIAVLEKEETEAWFKFTVAANEHIFIRCSSDAEYVGMNAVVKDGLGNSVSTIQKNPEHLIGKINMAGLYLDCDNTSSTTQTYYVLVQRGTYDVSKGIYFYLAAENRIKTGQATFSFSGSATNSGNKSLSLAGINSTELMLNLTNSTQIPKEATVTRVTTTGVQSPSQGNVHHLVKAKDKDNWYTSTVASNDWGTYAVNVADEIMAKQIWYFKYNVLSPTKSTMSKIKLILEWQYDVNNTKYASFIN
ncbi:MAG: hypothetical protein ACERKN_20200 [Velocimicrobium sp.]